MLTSSTLPSDTVREYEVQFHQRLEQERAQWNQYREAVEREMGELRHRLSEGGQEEENLENDMKKVGWFHTGGCHQSTLILSSVLGSIPLQFNQFNKNRKSP